MNTVEGNCTINFNCCHSSANQSRDGNSSRQDSQNLMRSRQITPKRKKNGREYEDPYDIEERIKFKVDRKDTAPSSAILLSTMVLGAVLAAVDDSVSVVFF